MIDKCRWEGKMHGALVPSQSLCRKEVVGPARDIICPNKSGWLDLREVLGKCGEILRHGLREAPEKSSLLSGSREPICSALCCTHFPDASCDGALNYFRHYGCSQDKGETSSKKSKKIKLKKCCRPNLTSIKYLFTNLPKEDFYRCFRFRRNNNNKKRQACLQFLLHLPATALVIEHLLVFFTHAVLSLHAVIEGSHSIPCHRVGSQQPQLKTPCLVSGY